MAIRFICEIVLHLLQHAINCVFGVDVPSFFEILLFEVVAEISKYLTLEPQLSSPSDTEPLVPLEQLVTSNGNNKTGDLETPSRNVRKKTPLSAVYSTAVFKICEALDLKAELRPETERPTFVIKKKRSIPVVRSRAVFSLCQALKLPALLADF
ncbi:hypothetical protein NPIL_666541 [Nephila pilipes]|uniref:Uncharacterized protein n=1 Tax=Nephila pilipes TaxID=299642 RepID=A0A8X6N352_NEPPI|nr:hypothetical protein NPIL_666541 [Nephila pilipes]